MDRRVLMWIVVAALALLLLGGGAVVALKALTKSEIARKAQLLPHVREALERFQAAAAAKGIETYIGSTGRSETEQKAKVAAGLSDTQQSWHLLGRAVHVVPVVAGEPDIKVAREDLLRELHVLAPRFGFHSIAYKDPVKGDFTKKYLKSGAWDANHFEYRDGMTFAQAAAAQKKAVG